MSHLRLKVGLAKSVFFFLVKVQKPNYLKSLWSIVVFFFSIVLFLLTITHSFSVMTIFFQGGFFSKRMLLVELKMICLFFPFWANNAGKYPNLESFTL